MTKTIFLVMVVGMTTATVLGQSMKDFYIPQSDYNKASFYSPSQTGERTSMTRVIYYILNDDGSYDIMDANMMEGKPTSIITQTVLITATGVKMTKSISTSLLETNKQQSYEPPRVLLKMPLAGQTATWIFQGEEGAKPTKFTSSWTTVTVDGVSKKAIKVVSQYTGWASKTVTYYVQGIGMMKMEFIGEDGKTKPFENFDGLSYEQTKK